MPNPIRFSTTGGTNTYVKYSGTLGGDTLIYAGAGYLNTIVPFIQGLSGLPVLFYDSPVATAGAPFPASGNNLIGVMPGIGSTAAGVGPIQASGDLTAALPIQVNMPFNSGLCHNSVSGQIGFAAIYTPFAVPQGPIQPIQNVVGGTKTYTSWSGTIAGVRRAVSGAGRLNTVQFHVEATSGKGIIFYDSAYATQLSGGPIAASGDILLASFGASPTSGTTFGLSPIQLNMPFHSGLAHTSASGQVGFTISYTPSLT